MHGQNDQGEETVETAPDIPETPAARPASFSPLRSSLSRFQTFVGLTAGVVSITGALLSFTGYFKPAAGTGKLVAIVQDRNNAAVGDATVEVLTARKAVVTTLAANARGRASVPIEPGAYILQVRHPRLGSETRVVEIRPGLTAEVRVSLRGSVSVGANAATTSAGAAPVVDSPAAVPASASPAASPATAPRATTEPPPRGPARGGAQAP